MTTESSASSDFLTTARPKSPYPGLRPFEIEEWSIFFGREQMIDEVIDRLARPSSCDDPRLFRFRQILAGARGRIAEASTPTSARRRVMADLQHSAVGRAVVESGEGICAARRRRRRHRAHRPDRRVNSTVTGRHCPGSPARSKASKAGDCASWSTNLRSFFDSRRKRVGRRPNSSSISWFAAM